MLARTLIISMVLTGIVAAVSPQESQPPEAALRKLEFVRILGYPDAHFGQYPPEKHESPEETQSRVECSGRAFAVRDGGDEVAFADAGSIRVRPSFTSLEEITIAYDGARALHFTNPGDGIVVLGPDPTIAVVDLKQRQVKWSKEFGAAKGVVLHPEYPWVMVWNSSSATIFDLTDGTEIATRPTENLQRALFLPDGKYLALLSSKVPLPFHPCTVEFVPLAEEGPRWDKSDVQDRTSDGVLGTTAVVHPEIPGVLALRRFQKRSETHYELVEVRPKTRSLKTRKRLENGSSTRPLFPCRAGLWFGTQMLDPKSFKVSSEVSVGAIWAIPDHSGRFVYVGFQEEGVSTPRRLDVSLGHARTGLVPDGAVEIHWVGPDQLEVLLRENRSVREQVRVRDRKGKRVTRTVTRTEHSYRVARVGLNGRTEVLFETDEALEFSPTHYIEKLYEDQKLDGLRITDRETGKARKVSVEGVSLRGAALDHSHLIVRDNASKPRRVGILDVGSRETTWIDLSCRVLGVFSNGNWLGTRQEKPGRWILFASEPIEQGDEPEDLWTTPIDGAFDQVSFDSTQSSFLCGNSVYEASSGKKKFEVEGDSTKKFMRGGDLIVCDGGFTRIYDGRTGALLAALDIDPNDVLMSVSPDGSHAVLKRKPHSSRTRLYKIVAP